MPEILITGATGFIGKAVVNRLLAEKESRRVAVAMRTSVKQRTPRVVPFVTGDLGPSTDWTIALKGILVVVHCAARVHLNVDKSNNPLKESRRVNVEGTLNLARQSAAKGVKRFVFVSSIKVNGDITKPGEPFTADDDPAPLDAYGVSKMEAEQGLLEIAQQTNMEVVIIRPPLVYGPGAKANFAAMLRWLKSGVPLPFGSIHNQRSLVALDNLVDLISICLSHPSAANEIFLIADGEDVSTSELLRRICKEVGWPIRLFPAPSNWLKIMAAILGRKDLARRLCESLQVDDEKTRRLLNWTPPLSLDEGLKKATKGL